MFRPVITALSVGLLSLAAPAASSLAQDFPTQPVKLVVPYPPGGGVDGLARPIAERLSQIWSKPVIIDNRPGASTILGTEAVVKAPPDGHTLLFTSDSTVTSNPHLFRTLSYDPVKDLAPVTQIIDLIQLVIAHPSLPATTSQDLIALAKAKPNTLNYASYGSGSQPHLFFEGLRQKTGAAIEHIPFKGLGPALQAVVAGETQLTLAGPAISGGHVKAGKLKVLLVSANQRASGYPDVPTLSEVGLADIDPKSWFGILAPAKTPPAIVERIQRAVAGLVKDTEFDAKFISGRGFVGVASTPVEFAKFIAADLADKKRLIDLGGIKPE